MQVAPEPAAIVDDHGAYSWPEKGRIELKELKIRYCPNAPLVRNGITCTFRKGSKVGVVGRSGNGKTTFISALFRLVELTSGRICIDGLDIPAIGLKDLRMKLSIIPQEPMLFRGNVHPLGLYSDSEIWNGSTSSSPLVVMTNLQYGICIVRLIFSDNVVFREVLTERSNR